MWQVFGSQFFIHRITFFNAGVPGKINSKCCLSPENSQKGETELLMSTDFAEEKQIDFQPETIKIQEIL